MLPAPVQTPTHRLPRQLEYSLIQLNGFGGAAATLGASVASPGQRPYRRHAGAVAPASSLSPAGLARSVSVTASSRRSAARAISSNTQP
jgi:hypothetical protein